MSRVPDASGRPPRDGRQRLALVLSWAVVAIPALWGVAQVVARSLALFR